MHGMQLEPLQGIGWPPHTDERLSLHVDAHLASIRAHGHLVGLECWQDNNEPVSDEIFMST